MIRTPYSPLVDTCNITVYSLLVFLSRAVTHRFHRSSLTSLSLLSPINPSNSLGYIVAPATLVPDATTPHQTLLFCFPLPSHLARRSHLKTIQRRKRSMMFTCVIARKAFQIPLRCLNITMA